MRDERLNQTLFYLARAGSSHDGRLETRLQQRGPHGALGNFTLAAIPVDFREGATGLMGLLRNGEADPFGGALVSAIERIKLAILRRRRTWRSSRRRGSFGSGHEARPCYLASCTPPYNS